MYFDVAHALAPCRRGWTLVVAVGVVVGAVGTSSLAGAIKRQRSAEGPDVEQQGEP